MPSAALSTRRLSVSRGRRRVLSEITLDFDRGITAILGPNGAGKTTLLETLARLEAAENGEILVAGDPVKTQSQRREAFRAIGFMPQNWQHFTGYTAWESIAYAGWLKGIPGAGAKQAAYRALGEVNLQERAGDKVRRLSGGMRQRVGLAEALVNDPTVVILDEPTVGLDPQQRIDFRAALRGRADRAAIILSTHLTDDVSALADRVLVLHEGKIRFDGTVAGLEQQGASSPARHGETPLERGYLTVLENAA